jgi:hypothetical protein
MTILDASVSFKVVLKAEGCSAADCKSAAHLLLRLTLTLNTAAAAQVLLLLTMKF